MGYSTGRRVHLDGLNKSHSEFMFLSTLSHSHSLVHALV